MTAYPYRHLLGEQYKLAEQYKEALPLASLGRGLMSVGRGAISAGRGAANFGKGLLFAGPTAKAGLGAKAMNVAGKATGVGVMAAPMLGTVGQGPAAQNGPSLNMLGHQIGGPGSQPGAHYGEENAQALLKSASLALLRREKVSSAFGKVVEPLSYAAMIGSKFVDPNSKWHAALDYGGLAGLGASTLHGMATDPNHEFKPGLKDLAGLALFASGVHDRAHAHGPTLPLQAPKLLP